MCRLLVNVSKQSKRKRVKSNSFTTTAQVCCSKGAACALLHNKKAAMHSCCQSEETAQRETVPDSERSQAVQSISAALILLSLESSNTDLQLEGVISICWLGAGLAAAFVPHVFDGRLLCTWHCISNSGWGSTVNQGLDA